VPEPVFDPLAEARAQAVRRILESRGERPADDPTDLRALVARANEASAATKELSALLPTRLEAAVGRAIAEDASGVSERLEEIQDDTTEIGDAVARVELDLLAERLGRIEDLEMIIELFGGGIKAIRSDLARLGERLDRIEGRLDAVAPSPAAETPSSPRQAYRSLFARTEPRGSDPAERSA
jgi:hypothetical protein